MTQAGFDDRYGDGALARLQQLLQQPCITFAQIATAFGVTRERVRQWHQEYLPEAPTGHERQQLCSRQRMRRRVFEDALFREFFQRARPFFGTGRIQPIRSRAGYRPRTVRIDNQVVALRDAASLGNAAGWYTFRYRGQADYVFVRLAGGSFVFAPARLLTDPSARKRLTEAPYRDSFASFEAGSAVPSVAARHEDFSPI